MSDEKNTYCNMACEEEGGCSICCPPEDKVKKAFDLAWEICKEQPCGFRGCGASSADGPEMCVAGENPSQCQRRRATAKHSSKAQKRRGGKVKHLEIGDDY